MNESIIRGVRHDDAEWGSTPTRKSRAGRRKSTVRWHAVTSLFALVALAVFSALEAHNGPQGRTSDYWAAVVFFASIAIVALVYNECIRRPGRRR